MHILIELGPVYVNLGQLLSELDFTIEARYTDELRQNLIESSWVDSERLTVPQIFWPLTNSKILVMEWLQGKPLLEAELPQANQPETAQSKATFDWAKDKPIDQRSEVTSLLFRAFLSQYFITGFFHADPHPGNIFYLDDFRALANCQHFALRSMAVS